MSLRYPEGGRTMTEDYVTADEQEDEAAAEDTHGVDGAVEVEAEGFA